jgi:hypothetical protein
LPPRQPPIHYELPRWFLARRKSSEKIVERLDGHKNAGATFYHYTDVPALLSMLTTGEIWLSDATFLNDRTEVQFGLDVTLACLAEVRSDPSNSDLADFLEATIACFENKKRPAAFVCCFSLNGDDLSQWRGYAGRGKGIAIGFKAAGNTFFVQSMHAGLNLVYYALDEQRFIINIVISEFVEALREDLNNPLPGVRKMPRAEELEICSDSLYYELWRYIVTFKHAGFASEREVRFVYWAHEYSENDRGWAPRHPPPLCRSRGGDVVPYITSGMLDLTLDHVLKPRPRPVIPLPIVEVVIGPRPEPNLLERGLRYALSAQGHEGVRLTHSKIPFRG